MGADLVQAFTNFFAAATSAVRDTRLDLVQLFSNIVVGALSAWAAGSIGVRHGLQRAQRERAFERRLTWYEDAIRVTFRFKRVIELLVIAHREKDAIKRMQIMESVVKNLDEVLESLSDTINKSLVYSSQDVYLALKKVFAQVMNLNADTSRLLQGEAGSENVAAVYESQGKLLDESLFLLAASIRRLLKMDKIRRKNFDEDFGAPKQP